MITFSLAWLFLPWVLAPWGANFIRRYGNYRRWLLATQMLSVILFFVMSFLLSSFLSPLLSLLIIACFALLAFIFALHDIVSRKYLVEYAHTHGITRSIGRLFFFIAIIITQGLLITLGGNLEVLTRDIHFSWSMVFYVVAGIMLAIMIYHFFKIPQDVREATFTPGGGCEGNSLRTLFFILPYGLMLIISTLFLIDRPHTGGLGLSPGEYGLAMGTVGVIGFALGCSFSHRTLVHPLHSPLSSLLYCLTSLLFSVIFWVLSLYPQLSLAVITLSIFIAQLAIGFGFTAYRTYIINNVRTSRQGQQFIAMSALAVLLPNLAAGWIQETLGYQTFFLIALGANILVVLATVLLSHRQTPK